MLVDFIVEFLVDRESLFGEMFSGIVSGYGDMHKKN